MSRRRRRSRRSLRRHCHNSKERARCRKRNRSDHSGFRDRGYCPAWRTISNPVVTLNSCQEAPKKHLVKCLPLGWAGLWIASARDQSNYLDRYVGFGVNLVGGDMTPASAHMRCATLGLRLAAFSHPDQIADTPQRLAHGHALLFRAEQMEALRADV